MTAAQRAYALDRAVSQSDREIVADADGALLLDLEKQWWKTHRDTFHEAFESACSPEEWAGIARAKDAELTEFLANAIREGMGTRDVSLPDEFSEEEAA